MVKSPDDPEGRTTPRRRVLLSGKVIYGDPPMTLDCSVFDLSAAGARIRLEGPEPLKDPIYLIVVRQDAAYLANEAWRRGALIGLSFARTFDLANPPADLPRLVRQIWVEQTRASR